MLAALAPETLPPLISVFAGCASPTTRSTPEIPSRNRVWNKTLALENMPSFRETTINCDPLKRDFSSLPMLSVCDRSRAASTSSRMYNGAGLNCSRAKISDSATRELKCWKELVFYRWPPLSSVRLCFQIPPRHTLISRPSVSGWPSRRSSLAELPGSSIPNISPKSLLV